MQEKFLILKQMNNDYFSVLEVSRIKLLTFIVCNVTIIDKSLCMKF